MKHIAIITVGTRGDVQPYVALGVGLQAAGYRVTVITSRSFGAMIRERGLEHAPLELDALQMMEDPENRAALTSPKEALRMLKQVSVAQRKMLEEEWESAKDADAIIYHPKAMGGYHIAEKLRVPAFLAMMLPAFSPTREFPNPIVTTKNLGSFLNWQSYTLVSRLATVSMQKIINNWRRDMLKLPSRSLRADDLILHQRPVTRIYAYSEAVLPRPADWDASTVVTGYWFLNRQDQWQPPEDLVQFLRSGAAPIYIGFGSMAGRQPEQISDIVLSALQRTGRRAIIATGVGGLVKRAAPESIFFLKSAPHDWLFPYVAAIVHHGGAGTTAAALRAGKPMLICPFFGDQPFWGKRMFELGVAPAPQPQKKMTVDQLVHALQQLTGDEEIAHRAERMGEIIRAEDGVARAVQVICGELEK